MSITMTSILVALSIKGASDSLQANCDAHRPSLWARMRSVREARAARYVSRLLAGISDERLAGFGYSARDIAELRARHWLPTGSNDRH